jgi:hypothetical protein
MTYAHSQSLTERELLALHSQVRSMQNMYGLSYKDAAHWLYHSEVQKLHEQHRALRMLNTITLTAEAAIKDINQKINDVDLEGGLKGAD